MNQFKARKNAVKWFALSLFLFAAVPNVLAQEQPELGRYVRQNCGFSGMAVDLKPNGRFERSDWDDVVLRFEPPDASTYQQSARGAFEVSGDTLWLTFREVVFDSIRIERDLGKNPKWGVTLEEWEDAFLSMRNHRKPFMTVSSILGRDILVMPGHEHNVPSCRDYVENQSMPFRGVCGADACRGILLPLLESGQHVVPVARPGDPPPPPRD
ncbi:MAG: hypothetical protein AAGI52_18425 [Bacteroidota bacterium]